MYFEPMNFAGKLSLVASAAVLLTAVSVRAEEANPYTGIVVRNIFALVPIPTNPPVDVKPPDPPIKISPNGIMNVFGQLEVIFKAAIPAMGKEPAHDQSYVMAEGEREDDIEVVKIDDKASIITFINHGIKQDLPLADAPNVTAPAPSPGGPGGGVPMPASALGSQGIPNRPMRNGPVPGSPAAARASILAAAGMSDPAPPSGGAGQASGATQNQTELTPEEQIVNTEKQRAQWLDQGNPAAAIVPPTSITKQLMDGGQNAEGANKAPGR
jgi:hypothetical protein